MDLIKKIKNHYLINWSKGSECISGRELIHDILSSFDVLNNLKKSELLVPADIDVIKRKAAICGIQNDIPNGLNVRQPRRNKSVRAPPKASVCVKIMFVYT